MVRDELVQLTEGARELRLVPPANRSRMLEILAQAIVEHTPLLLKENERDYAEHASHLEPALAQRLTLSEDKIATLSRGLQELARLEDPLGALLARTQLDDGLILDKVSVPLGVVSVIFESRPDVLYQVLGLTLRTGNGVALKGGREATLTNRAMVRVAQEVLEKNGFPYRWFCLLEGRESVDELLKHDDLVDLVIPRGSNEFVRHIQENSRIPVLGHASGVCHLYVHPSANVDAALKVIIDAKTQYPAACNAAETILVDRQIAPTFLPLLRDELIRAGVTVRVCSESSNILNHDDIVRDDEWNTEYGALTIAIKVVPDMNGAIEHINRHGSHHTDGILAQDQGACESFVASVDSASVFANCSTRFADGYRFGFGAEIGIGTGKLHARGPVGMEGLLTYKYILRGKGHIVASYSGAAARPFKFSRMPLPTR
jgi:glutamate-5-semialdehyde dehydrogenase